MKNKRRNIMMLFIILIIFTLCIGKIKKVYATTNNETLKNTTIAYFCSEITKTYGSGDCILLENYDSKGNKICKESYSLICIQVGCWCVTRKLSI